MHLHDFEWDEKNENHIANHGVISFEVEEALLLDKPLYLKGREGKYIAYAVTEDGRYLFIVFVLKDKGLIRVITARDMIQREKRYYQKKKGVR